MVNQFFPCNERVVDNQDMEFSILILPFKTDFCSFVIEKFKKIDHIRLVCMIKTTPKIQKILKELPENEIQLTMEEFDKLYHLQFKTDYIFSKNYESIQNMTYFPIQNLSTQSLVDSIFLNTILAKEAVKFLIIMDKGMETPEVDSNNSMYK